MTFKKCFTIWDKKINQTGLVAGFFMQKFLNHKIVLFDGVCNYCNALVNFAIRNDRKAKLKFAMLQSEKGKQLKLQYNIDEKIDSVVYIENDKVFTYSDAALKIAGNLDYPARLLYALIIIPKFIRQPIYRWIAKNRYKWFGKKETCMNPSPEIKNRFIS